MPNVTKRPWESLPYYCTTSNRLTPVAAVFGGNVEQIPIVSTSSGAKVQDIGVNALPGGERRCQAGVQG